MTQNNPNAGKHTPGPWTNDPLQPTIWTADGETKVATIADLPWKERGSDWMTEQANARLIAASPELLEACQLAEKHYLPTPVLLVLRNAILKAGGQIE